MYFSIPNLSETSTVQIPEPWNFQATAKYADFSTKMKFTEWCKDATTKHAFLSGYEGINPTIRIGEDNPPFKMHALILDYDGPFNPAQDMPVVIDNPPGTYPPAYVARTYSGHARAIWPFEAPALLTESKEHTKRFLQIMLKNIKAQLWFRGFEESAALNVQKYYEVGADWMEFPGAGILRRATIEKWLYDAAQKMEFADHSGTRSIPMEDIAAEVNKRFPGRWRGPFNPGARGVRFWDPSADNPTAAVVHPEGMFCFTGNEGGFVSWSKIFGRSWVDQFETAKIGTVRAQTAYDGRSYWVESSPNKWEEMQPDVFGMWLKCLGFSGRNSKGKTSSEVDRIKMDIIMNRKVTAAVPFVHFPPGIRMFNGRQILNVSTVKALAPAPEGTAVSFADGPKLFPMIHSFLGQFFDDEAESILEGMDQLTWFICWLKWAYENALLQTPQPGQVLCIAGDEGVGKTFMSQVIVGTLLGGIADASNFVVEGSRWNEDALGSPLMCIDDALALSSRDRFDRFSSLVKKIAANKVFEREGKYKIPGQVLWCGRMIVSLNKDGTSRKIIPSLDMSSRTKIALLMSHKSRRFKFPERQLDTQQIIQQELPYFARALLEFQIPDIYKNAMDTRYHLRTYHHPELYREAVRSGDSHTFLELLLTFLADYSQVHAADTHWSGSHVELYRSIATMTGMLEIMRKHSTKTTETNLRALQAHGYPLEVTWDTSGLQKWRIPVKLGAVSYFETGKAGTASAPVVITNASVRTLAATGTGADMVSVSENNPGPLTVEEETENGNDECTEDTQTHEEEPVQVADRSGT